MSKRNQGPLRHFFNSCAVVVSNDGRRYRFVDDDVKRKWRRPIVSVPYSVTFRNQKRIFFLALMVRRTCSMYLGLATRSDRPAPVPRAPSRRA